MNPTDLSADLAAAREERDRALHELASVRVELDALRQALKRKNEAEPPLYPSDGRPPEIFPLRYRVADVVNDRVKQLGRPLHVLLRRWFDRASS